MSILRMANEAAIAKYGDQGMEPELPAPIPRKSRKGLCCKRPDR
jgi:hypothetical protein